MEWKVTNALNRDVERQHLNAILKDIKATIDSLSVNDSTNTSTVTQIINGSIGGSTASTGIGAFMLTLAGGVSGSANINGDDVTLTTTLNTDGLVEEAPEDNQYYWRWNGTWQPVPNLLQNLVDVDGQGFLVQYQKPSHETDYVTRSIEVVSGELTITNADGVSANPSLGLADVADTGIGVSPIKLITRDAKGRVEGTQDADTDDLPEGASNLYFTVPRVQTVIDNSVTAGVGDGITLSYNIVTNGIDATNTDKGSIAVAAHVADSDPHTQYALESSLGSLATVTPTGTGDSTTFLRGDDFWTNELAGSLGLNTVGLASSATLYLTVDNGYYAAFAFRTNNLQRWQFYKDATSETGSNAGSNFNLIGYDDTGASLGTYWYMGRSTGATGFKGTGAFGGITGQAQVKLLLQGSSTGAVTSYGLRVAELIQSDVTTQYNGAQIASTTATAAFTLAGYNGMSVTGPTVGAGSTITSANAFNVAASFISATNNYGFRGAIPSGTNNWNLYFDGTAPNYMVSGLRLGTTSANSATLVVAGSTNATGATTRVGLYLGETAQSSVTSRYSALQVQPANQATAYTLTSLDGLYVAGFTPGAGSTITTYSGLRVLDTTGPSTVAAANLQVTSGTGKWNLYAGGSANNYMAGSLGIGTTTLNASALRVVKTITGGTAAYGITCEGAIQSDVTSAAQGFRSALATAAVAFTVSDIYQFIATQGTFGAGSTVTRQHGFHAASALTGAASNFGFYGNIPASGTANWNFYAPGSAPNYMAGGLSIGTSPSGITGYSLYINKSITGGTTAQGVGLISLVQSDVTAAANSFFTNIGTAAASFTLPDLRHYLATQSTFGAGSTVTRQAGFAAAASLTGASSNYGFQGNLVASGSANWNLYMQGTAPNYFAGQLSIGSTALDASAALIVTSTTQGLLPPRMTTTQRDAISSPTSGLIIYNTTTGKLNVRGASAWEEITSV